MTVSEEGIVLQTKFIRAFYDLSKETTKSALSTRHLTEKTEVEMTACATYSAESECDLCF